MTVRGEDFDAAVVVKGKEAVRAKMLEIQQKGKEASAKDNASYATLQIVNEMLARGIEVLPIDIYKSDARKIFGGGWEKSVCRLALCRESAELPPPLSRQQGKTVENLSL